MKCIVCTKEFDGTKIKFDGACSWGCMGKLSSVTCVYCGKRGRYLPESMQAKTRLCSKKCFDDDRVSKMLGFLFTNNKLPGGGQQFTQFLDDTDLARVAQVNKSLNRAAMLTQMGTGYAHDAKHFDSGRGEVRIPKAEMIEIALGAYRAALKLHRKAPSKKVPVILYRVSDKGKLTRQEEDSQTVSGAAKTKDALWPVERTAAWIQGAMRARVPFILLTDPRGVGALVGGRDKTSDAVFVRELFQITRTHYTIGKADEDDLPAALKGKSAAIFKLNPPDKDIGPLPIIPRMSAEMSFHHTWDASKSSLTLLDDPGLMSDHLVALFTQAGTELKLPKYA